MSRHHLPSQVTITEGHFFLEYVESLEKEITELKSKNRSLRQQIEEVVSQSAKPPKFHGWSASHGVHPQDPFVQAHIKELNGTIGKKLTTIHLVKPIHINSILHLKGTMSPGFCSSNNTTCYSFSCTKYRFHRKRKISSEVSNRHQTFTSFK